MLFSLLKGANEKIELPGKHYKNKKSLYVKAYRLSLSFSTRTEIIQQV